MRRTAEELGLVLPDLEEKWECRQVEFHGADGRQVTVIALHEEAGFRVRCRTQDAWPAGGTTADLAAVARAVAAWTGGSSLEHTQAAAPFIRYRPWALDHEREPLDRIELAWRHTIDRFYTPPGDRHPHVLALLEAAHAQPALRRLRPVTSHFILWFSTRATFPYTPVGYSIDPHHTGQYLVRDKGEVIARTTTPEEAVLLTVAALPKDTGPAH
ncbi:DUF6193 family natural product biosynthesis protein [Streptomyces sp. CB03911]|uniref:DUF6193 family natural product biosynthesis protein n=1 Tax=Streptomycetaceae TaxID=2062 RepID=UPI000939BECC|nr:DUF6193 family natural product biosynthesis protein [Streptomyces sp. CB03911]OKI29173.1 hypothetical protein A6A07_23600 [Streptomyces sp. CB03911]